MSGKLKEICIEDEIRIPPTLTNFESFRRWIRSRHYPRLGDVFWLDGTIWVGTFGETLEENQAKLALVSTLATIVKNEDLGYYFMRGARFSHPGAGVSCETDGLFFSNETLDQIRTLDGELGEAVEFEGAPDVAIEIISRATFKKDTEILPRLYFAAGIKEYWLVDVRWSKVQFDILRRGAKAFVKTPRRLGNVRSSVFGRSFQMMRDTNRVGHPSFELLVS